MVKVIHPALQVFALIATGLYYYDSISCHTNLGSKYYLILIKNMFTARITCLRFSSIEKLKTLKIKGLYMGYFRILSHESLTNHMIMPKIFEKSSIVSPHSSSFRIADQIEGRDAYYYALSGIYPIHQEAKDQGWLRDTVLLEIPLIKLPPRPELTWDIVSNYINSPDDRFGSRSERINSFLQFPKGWNYNIKVHSVTPYATLNAVFNGGRSTSSGYSVDSFRMPSKDEIRTSYNFNPDTEDSLWLEIDYAVRNRGAFLYRVGYSIQVILSREVVPPRYNDPNII